jgi:hypothetical protein
MEVEIVTANSTTKRMVVLCGQKKKKNQLLLAVPGITNQANNVNMDHTIDRSNRSQERESLIQWSKDQPFHASACTCHANIVPIVFVVR